MDTKMFEFNRLPGELQILVLDSCANKTLASMLSVNHKVNDLTNQVLSSRLTNLCGLPTTHISTPTPPSAPLQFLLKVYSPQDLRPSSVNWFAMDYVENNHFSDFHYSFNHTYCSQPSSAHNSDNDMQASAPDSSSAELIPQSKFAIAKPIDSFRNRNRFPPHAASIHAMIQAQEQAQQQHQLPNQVATLDIVDGDNFGQIELELFATAPELGNTIPLVHKTQRIYAEWADDFEYIVHNREVTCKVQVIREKTDEDEVRVNDFGEKYTRFKVIVSEMVVNMAYILAQLES